MGSVGSQSVWASYYTSADCSQGVCSIYCPQFCYLIFPPPPPDHDSTGPFSPLVIVIICIFLSGFLLVSYYTLVTRLCGRRIEQTQVVSSQDHLPVVSNGLDESVVKRIKVCKYQKGNGVIEGTDCAVCLSEFKENESLRLLPSCSHAFHLPCIDTWLKSQSNCPLCRASVTDLQTPPALKMNTDEFRRPDDLILVVDQQRSCQESEGERENLDKGDERISGSIPSDSQCEHRRDAGTSKGRSSDEDTEFTLPTRKRSAPTCEFRDDGKNFMFPS